MKFDLKAIKADAGRILSTFVKAAIPAIIATQVWTPTNGSKGAILSAIVAGGAAGLRAVEAVLGLAPKPTK